jgi:hypothetical protein
MFIIHWYKIPVFVALGVIAGVLLFSIVASFVSTRRQRSSSLS